MDDKCAICGWPIVDVKIQIKKYEGDKGELEIPLCICCHEGLKESYKRIILEELAPKEKFEISLKTRIRKCKSRTADDKICKECFGFDSCYENGKKREQNS